MGILESISEGSQLPELRGRGRRATGRYAAGNDWLDPLRLRLLDKQINSIIVRAAAGRARR
ncbi:MAG: hypothetical protein U0802_24685 [Candidatus Binatia bacterium]